MGRWEGFIAISFLCRKLRKWLTRIPDLSATPDRALKSAARIRGREYRHGSLHNNVRVFQGLPLLVPQ